MQQDGDITPEEGI